jgi:hypothetical protein
MLDLIPYSFHAHVKSVNESPGLQPKILPGAIRKRIRYGTSAFEALEDRILMSQRPVFYTRSKPNNPRKRFAQEKGRNQHDCPYSANMQRLFCALR